MNPKEHRPLRIGIALAGAAVICGLLVFLNRPDPKEGPGTGGALEPGGEATAVAETAKPAGAASAPGREIVMPERSQGVRVLDVARATAQLHREDGDASEDLGILQDLLGHYRRIHGANPEGGLNFEIVASLAGANERKLAVLPPNHPSLNEAGELLDRWGNPYWFHPVSRELMEIVSAGPDGDLWTEDDVRLD